MTQSVKDSPQSFRGDQLWSTVSHYAGIGAHLTGTKAERDTNEWLQKSLEKLGYNCSFSRAETGAQSLINASVLLKDQHISCSAQYRAPGTENNGITGTAFYIDVAAPTPNGAIAVCELPFHRWSDYEHPALQKAICAAEKAEAKALICITQGPSGATCSINAPLMAASAPMPIVYVGPLFADPIRTAASHQMPLTVTVEFSGMKIESTSLVASRKIPAPNQKKAIVISTPTTGWGPCAGERGAGIALALYLAESLSKLETLPVHFLFSSGHELGFTGIRQFILSDAPPPSQTAAWLHLGASIASRDYHETPNGLLPLPSGDPHRFALATSDWLEDCQKAFNGEPGLECPYQASPETAAGELRIVLENGYHSVLGIFGANRFHHTPLDAPSVTTPVLLEKAAVAVERALTYHISRLRHKTGQAA